MLHTPVDRNIRVVPANAAVGLRRIEIIRLVEEFHVVRKRDEAVSEAARDQKLLFVFLRQLHRDPLPVGRALGAQIHRHVQHRAAGHAHQLGLGHGRVLEVDAPQDALLGGEGLVVLHEVIVQAQLLEVPGGPGLHEIAALVAEHLGLDDVHARQLGFDLVHQ